jgi:molecular chaperone DnaJ
MSGEGEGGVGGGPPGDLYVVLHVREHPVFERQGLDLFSVVPVSFSQCALGTELAVETIDGKDEMLDIPAGTQSGTQFRLRGHGVPSLDGAGRGDHFVTVHVRIPKRLSKTKRELIEQLAELDGEDHDEPGLFDRVKKIFN